jgi:exodeoxyribonuclease-3
MKKIKIATWNVNSILARLDRLKNFLKTENPDVVCLQELKCQEEKYPFKELEELGYYSEVVGQKSYNGVSILSKEKAKNVFKKMDTEEDSHARFISAELYGIKVHSLYVPNGKDLTDPAFEYKLKWLMRLKAHLKVNYSEKDCVLLTGDFNIAPTDLDVYDPVKWKNRLHCSVPERDTLNELVSFGFEDTYRKIYPDKKEFSWWDYRNGSFWRNWGLRIDFLLATAPLMKKCKETKILREERKGEKPSDHVPVISVFEV